MNAPRTRFLCVAIGICAAGVGSLTLFTGCAGLDYSAQAEGTGVQIIGAVIVLAKYHASPKQKAVAEQRARMALVQAVKPAYEKRRTAVHAASAKKIEAARQDYDKRIGAASKAQAATQVPSASDEVRRLQQEKEEALAKLQADAAKELASVDTAWRSIGTADHSIKTGPKLSGAVPTASTRDEDALLASASAHLPRYVAVPVPPQGIAAEQGAKAMIMLWDTRLQRLASEDVLVLDRQVSSGVDVKVDGVTARVVKN